MILRYRTYRSFDVLGRISATLRNIPRLFCFSAGRLCFFDEGGIKKRLGSNVEKRFNQGDYHLSYQAAESPILRAYRRHSLRIATLRQILLLSVPADLALPTELCRACCWGGARRCGWTGAAGRSPSGLASVEPVLFGAGPAVAGVFADLPFAFTAPVGVDVPLRLDARLWFPSSL